MAPTDVGIYIVSVGFFLSAVYRVSAFASRSGLPWFLSACISSGLFLYLSSLIPGIFQVLSPLAVGLTMIICSILTHLVLSKLEPGFRPGGSGVSEVNPGWADGPWGAGNLLVAAAGFVAARPLLEFFVQYPRTLFKTTTPLPWDTVSYHLPGFVEIFQERSLWSMIGPFQSYAFGFELIGNFPSYFFQSHWGLLIAHAYAIVFLMGSIWLLVRQLVRALGLSHDINQVSAFLLSLGFWVFVFHNELYNVGKNDIFLTACILSTFSLLLEVLATDMDRIWNQGSTAHIVLATAAFGLALATKPIALAFIPFFGIMILVIARRARGRDGSRGPGPALVSLFALGSVLVGGFFSFRNLFYFGSLADPSLGITWTWSIGANLGNPALYKFQWNAVYFLCTLMTAIFLALLWQFRARPGNPVTVAFMVGLHGVSVVAFVATPSSGFHGSPDQAIWELRLGMHLFVLSGVCASVFLATLSTRLPWSRLAGMVRGRPGILACLSLVGIAVITVPGYWNSRHAEGLPGYEVTMDVPPTGIYEWVDSIDAPVRIYSAGLRPFGLYGKKWQHHVFYDLNSTALQQEETGKARLSLILRQFRPDLIILSVDPVGYTPSTPIPLVGWLRSQPGCYEQVYSDQSVAAFRVVKKCVEQTREDSSPSPPLRMGS